MIGSTSTPAQRRLPPTSFSLSVSLLSHAAFVLSVPGGPAASLLSDLEAGGRCFQGTAPVGLESHRSLMTVCSLGHVGMAGPSNHFCVLLVFYLQPSTLIFALCCSSEPLTSAFASPFFFLTLPDFHGASARHLCHQLSQLRSLPLKEVKPNRSHWSLRAGSALLPPQHALAPLLCVATGH